MKEFILNEHIIEFINKCMKYPDTYVKFTTGEKEKTGKIEIRSLNTRIHNICYPLIMLTSCNVSTTHWVNEDGETELLTTIEVW